MRLFISRLRPSLRACAAAAALAAGAAQAAEFTTLQLLNQSEFRAFSEDVAAATSYKPMIPSEGLGLTGFDLGISVAATDVAHRDTLRKAAGGGKVPKSVPLAGLRAVKGLPFDVDVGLIAVTLPSTNVRATGGEVRWAFIGGSTLVPAVALRLSTMGISGVDQLTMRTNSVDLSISKGFANLTPYAGIGFVDVHSNAVGTGLKKEKFGLVKGFVGLNIAFTPLALLVEADKTGDATTVGLKLALRW